MSANLLSLSFNPEAGKITFNFEGGAVTKEVLGHRSTAVTVNVSGRGRLDLTGAVNLSRLLLPQEELAGMEGVALSALAKNTAQIFKEKDMSQFWLGKLQAFCTNVEANQTYDEGKRYWKKFNDFLGLISKEYTGLLDALADFDH